MRKLWDEVFASHSDVHVVEVAKMGRHRARLMDFTDAIQTGTLKNRPGDSEGSDRRCDGLIQRVRYEGGRRQKGLGT